MPHQIYRIRRTSELLRGCPRCIRETAGRGWSDAARQESLELKVRIEQWIQQQVDPVLYRQGRRVGRLKELHLNLDCMARSLFLSCHIQGSKVRARIVRAVEDDFGTIALHTQRPEQIEFFEIRPELQT